MPTVQQLPLAPSVDPTDQIPIDKSGQTMSVSVATLTAGTQPKLTVASGSLLGRVSSGAGVPEPVLVGSGLSVSNGVLAAVTNSITLTGDVVGVGTDVIPTVLPSITAPGSYAKVLVNAKGQVTGGASLVSADIAGLDISTTSSIASGGTVSRSTALRQIDSFNVLDFGAVGDGVTRASAGINAAITAAAARTTGADVYLPAGNYRIDLSNASIFVKSGITLRGAGRGKTVLTIDDSNGVTATRGGNAGITNATTGGVFPTIADFHLRDLTLQGSRGQNGQNVTSSAFLMNLVNVRNVSVQNCEFLDSRGFSLGLFSGTDVLIRGNRVQRSNGDSIAVWDVANATITDNQIIMSGDDSISVHTNDRTAAPLRSGLVISNNNISDGPGIKVLGAKSATISGNVIRRGRNNGINVGFDPFFLQGDTPIFGVQIVNNTIEDMIDSSGFVTGSFASRYIWVGGSSKQAGSGASAPGTPVVFTGNVTPLYGSTTGNFYANGQSNVDGTHSVTGTTASPGGHWLRIENNTLTRTLPAVATWSLWGYGTALQVGPNGAYNGAITEAMLNQPGIHVSAALRNSRIAGNIIQTTGPYGIEFDRTVVDLDYDGLEIVGNRIADFSSYGVFWPSSTISNQRIRMVGNDLDGDPFFRSTNCGSNGSWLGTTSPVVGLYLAFVSGVEVEGNHFRNVTQPTSQSLSAVQVLRRNVVHCNPVATGFSTSNQGVGVVPPAGDDFTHVIETCDPASASYGKIKSATLATSSSQPTTGTYVVGHLGPTTTPTISGGQVFLGWKRLTTGATHVAGTDWGAVYGASGALVPTATLLGGAGGALTAISLGSGLAVSGGVLSATGPLTSVTTTYTGAGAIASSDNVALINTAGAVSMTLGAGSADGHEIIVKRFGAGAVTLTATIDGLAGASVLMNSPSLKEAISLTWSQVLNTWLMI